MAVSAVDLTTSKNETDLSSYSTASVTPTSNRLELLAVQNQKTSPPADEPTVTGCSLTWVKIATVPFATVASPGRRLTLFRALGASPTTGALTIDFAGATQNICQWSLTELDGMDTSGTNGSGAIVQSATAVSDATVTSLEVTLALFSNSLNAAYGCFAHNNREATTPGSGFTELGDTNGLPDDALETEWRADPDSSVDASWASASRCAGIAVEIKSALQGPNQHTLKVTQDGVTIHDLNTDFDGVSPGDMVTLYETVILDLRDRKLTLIDGGSYRGID